MTIIFKHISERVSFIYIYIYKNKKIINSRDGKMYPPLKVNTFNQTLGLN